MPTFPCRHLKSRRRRPAMENFSLRQAQKTSRNPSDWLSWLNAGFFSCLIYLALFCLARFQGDLQHFLANRKSHFRIAKLLLSRIEIMMIRIIPASRTSWQTARYPKPCSLILQYQLIYDRQAANVNMFVNISINIFIYIFIYILLEIHQCRSLSKISPISPSIQIACFWISLGQKASPKFRQA